ncbi:hypothetical protein KCP78_05915 [Salmonella enterica subsp. enterica]|nr:hypothetical protein KCP78_05915 [Salmonella enterica subsp. enterica]
MAACGTIVNVRPVQIQDGDDSNVIGAIGGAVLGSSSATHYMSGGCGSFTWRPQQAL